MKTTPWNAVEHLTMIESWLEARGTPIIKNRPDYYPEIGYVVDDTLVGFLFKTDAPAVAYLDAFVGNPAKNHEEIREAAVVLARRLKQAARANGIESVVAYTNKKSLIAAAEANDFMVDRREGIALLFSLTKEDK